MPTVRDFLERLRPSGTPGAASLSGVPADRVGERSAELEPVLARLSDVQAEAAQIRQAASVAAEARVAAAAERARALVSSARRSSEAERRDAAAQARAQAEAETRERLADAAREAASVYRGFIMVNKKSIISLLLVFCELPVKDIPQSQPNVFLNHNLTRVS